MHRAEPEHVAPEFRDVVEMLPDAVKGSPVKSRRVTWPGQIFSGSREPVDHDVVAESVAHPIGRGGRW